MSDERKARRSSEPSVWGRGSRLNRNNDNAMLDMYLERKRSISAVIPSS